MKLLLVLCFNTLIFAQLKLHPASRLHSFNFSDFSASSAVLPAKLDSAATLRSSYRSQFSIKELTIYSLHYSKHNYGLEFNSLNFDLYALLQADAWYSMKIKENLRIGTVLNYKHQKAKNYSAKQAASAGMSFFYETEYYTIHLAAFDLIESDLYTANYQLSFRQAAQLLELQYHLAYQEKFEQSILARLKMSHLVEATTAYHLEKEELAFSAFIRFEYFSFRYSISLHPDLAESHGLSLAMRL